MARYAAFLRGMNLGGRRITNDDLCAAVEAVGFSEPQAFLASGNLVFESRGKAKSIERKLAEGLEAELGYAVPCFVRSEAELIALSELDPFAGRSPQGPRGKPQVVFLATPPDAKATRAAMKLDAPADWLAIVGSELHWWPSGGISTSELDLKALEKILGAPTIRTRNTIDRMVGKFFR